MRTFDREEPLKKLKSIVKYLEEIKDFEGNEREFHFIMGLEGMRDECNKALDLYSHIQYGRLFDANRAKPAPAGG